MDLREEQVDPPRRRPRISQKLATLLQSIGRELRGPEPSESAKTAESAFGPEHDDYTETRNALTWLGL
jgi:hypothetical protein